MAIFHQRFGFSCSTSIAARFPTWKQRRATKWRRQQCVPSWRGFLEISDVTSKARRIERLALTPDVIRCRALEPKRRTIIYAALGRKVWRDGLNTLALGAGVHRDMTGQQDGQPFPGGTFKVGLGPGRHDISAVIFKPTQSTIVF